MNNEMNKSVTIINSLGLLNLFVNFIKFNKSGTAPYHNNQHTREMICNCYDGAHYYNLDEYCQQILVTAAMFHDFNHSTGKESDDINIRYAIEGFIKYSKDEGFSERFIWDVCQLIAATEYPYKDHDQWNFYYYVKNIEIDYSKWNKTLYLLKAIICDADVMTIYQEDEDILKNQLLGLYKEMSSNSNISKEEFIDGCKKFYKSRHFRTDWSIEKACNSEKLWAFYCERAINILEKYLN